MNGGTILIALVVLTVSTIPVSARTWRIAPDGSGDAPTIQSGIDSSAVGDTVLLACGTYYERGIQLVSGVCVRSETGSSDCATIDGEGMGSVLRADYVDNSASLEGLTITGGRATRGGGLHCTHAAPRVRGCVFVENRAEEEGAAIGYYYSDSPRASIEDSKFVENAAEGMEGTVYSEGVEVSMADCSFSDNWGGGSVVLVMASGAFERCSFVRNEGLAGGALLCALWPDYTIAVDSCVFVGNIAQEGGALWQRDGLVEIRNSVFQGNTASDAGGVYSEGDCLIRSCVFVGNSAAWYSSVIDPQGGAWIENTVFVANGNRAIGCGGPSSLTCCSIYGNSGGDWVSCIAGQLGVNGNFSADPLFCDAAAGDFTLRSDSPCLPGQHPYGYDCDLVGAFGQGCAGPTVVEHTSWGAVKALFR